MAHARKEFAKLRLLHSMRIHRRSKLNNHLGGSETRTKKAKPQSLTMVEAG